MKALFVLAALAMLSAPPPGVAARSYHGYGRLDPCAAAKTRAANNGALTGAVLGAVVGGTMAPPGAHLQTASADGAKAAKTGETMGAKSVKCLAYPHRYRARPDCHWIEDDSDGAPHQFEICRAPGGEWRASGRAI